MKVAALPPILREEQFDEAVCRVSCYLRHKFSSREEPGFNGAYFESIGRRNRKDPDPDRFTAADLYAVTTLSVKVPAGAGIRLLTELAETSHELLREIPDDVDFTDLIDSPQDPRFAELLGPQSKAVELWRLLDGLYDVGPTTTSKLMARKRPKLIPIWDSEIKNATGLRDSSHQWEQFRELFGTVGLVDRLSLIREKADAEHFSLLRVFDIAVWHAGSAPRRASRKRNPMEDCCKDR